jgi:hypothetical protein
MLKSASSNRIKAILIYSLVIGATLMMLRQIITLGILTFGDYPFTDIHANALSFLYVWTPNNLGTNIRQGLNLVRDVLLVKISFSNEMFYMLKFVFPLLLTPLIYVLLMRRLGVNRLTVLIPTVFFTLANPVVFGDYLSGQTFWIYPLIPLVYYTVMKIFYMGHVDARHIISLAILMFISFGMLPPILIPLTFVVMILVAIPAGVSLMRRDGKMFLSIIKTSLATGLLFGLLALPYLIVPTSGQSAYIPTNIIGDYLHNYQQTYILNTLRLAGNESNGQKH